jgi:hypothetical protein
MDNKYNLLNNSKKHNKAMIPTIINCNNKKKLNTEVATRIINFLNKNKVKLNNHIKSNLKAAAPLHFQLI